MKKNDIVVSVRCTVYNHEPFLHQCLDGFVKQITTFPFTVFVHDDASTDNSASIINQYAQRYPNIIIPYLEKENLYQKRDGRFIDVTYSPDHLNGKYIAFCEGDDYWTDPYKLQKQVDYMESHPDCTMCFGNAIEHWEDNSSPDKVFAKIQDKDYSGIELSDNWIVPTATAMIKREIIQCDLFKKYTSDKRIITGDLPLWLTCAAKGIIHGIPDVLCVYRRSNTGFMLTMNTHRRLAMGDTRIAIYSIFGGKYKRTCISVALGYYQRAILDELKGRNYALLFTCIIKFLKACLRYPDIAFYQLIYKR